MKTINESSVQSGELDLRAFFAASAGYLGLATGAESQPRDSSGEAHGSGPRPSRACSQCRCA